VFRKGKAGVKQQGRPICIVTVARATVDSGVLDNVALNGPACFLSRDDAGIEGVSER
jgi:hypothetical protein